VRPIWKLCGRATWRQSVTFTINDPLEDACIITLHIDWSTIILRLSFYKRFFQMLYTKNTTIIICVILISMVSLAVGFQKDFPVTEFDDLTVSGPFRSDLFQGDEIKIF
jgi:hypothetical protein